MARQRIRPLLLFKKRSGMWQRVSQNTYALANRLQAIPTAGSVPANAITDPTGGAAITDPTGGAYITES